MADLIGSIFTVEAPRTGVSLEINVYCLDVAFLDVVADHTESSTMSVNLLYLCFDNFSSIGSPKSSLGFGVAPSSLGSGRRSIAEADVPVLSSIGVDSVKQNDVDTEGLGSYKGKNSWSYVNYESNSGDYDGLTTMPTSIVEPVV
ncbi:hypothetical protein GIB67_012602 [Kingdonia uniflora]|uniref:Uncharacterized protein n=1 Tax=Kingdonia uniflora TaxID=39325 RepID=A0A7J7NEU5_9MAGN|nr:hypothetical protein GIB67_012602 [Kingdonia uniflora]